MTTNNQLNLPLAGNTGTGSYVGSASAALTGTPTLNAYALAPVTAWVAYTPTFTGFGTVSGVEFWSRRVGDSLEIRGKFVSGTSTAVTAQITLGFNGTNSNVTSSSTVITSLECVGAGAYSATNAQSNTVLIESNVGFMTLGLQSSGRAGYTEAQGSVLIGSGQTLAIFASVPVTTWP